MHGAQSMVDPTEIWEAVILTFPLVTGAAKRSSARNWEWEEESVSQAVTLIGQLHSSGWPHI